MSFEAEPLKEAAAWPVKTHEHRDWEIDSTRWANFQYRDGDVVIGSWGKSGTTWLQHIVAQLVHPEDGVLTNIDNSVWVDCAFFSEALNAKMLGNRTGRRILKTHLPLDAIPYSPKAKYIYVARDGRDVLLSWYDHHRNFSALAYRLINDIPRRVGPPLCRPSDSVRDYFHEWLDRNGYPRLPYWSHIMSWWRYRSLPNILLLHFRELRLELAASIQKLATHLCVPADEQKLALVLDHSSFAFMKKNSKQLMPQREVIFDGGASSFMNRGVDGRWQEILTEDDIRKYLATAQRELDGDCYNWLHGSSPGVE